MLNALFELKNFSVFCKYLFHNNYCFFFKTSGYNVECDGLWDWSHRSLMFLLFLKNRMSLLSILFSINLLEKFASSNPKRDKLRASHPYYVHDQNDKEKSNVGKVLQCMFSTHTNVLKYIELSFPQTKICLTGDTIHRIDILSRCFEKKKKNIIKKKI